MARQVLCLLVMVLLPTFAQAMLRSAHGIENWRDDLQEDAKRLKKFDQVSGGRGRSKGGKVSLSCQPGEPCWPSEDDILQLKLDLNASTPRNLNWGGYPQGMPTAVPDGSFNAQPLYGLGNNCTAIQAVYVNEDLSHICFTGKDAESFNGNGSSEFCKAAARNRPYKGYTPSFVAFCQSEAHVVSALQFAIDHDLCVMVAATGHEYLNRHTCSGGMMIRTTTMQEKQFIANYAKNETGAPNGAFKFGPGLTFMSAMAFATDFDRVISAGWCPSVGIVGWSLGGGHGPLAPSLGLGVDNTLEFTVVQVHEARHNSTRKAIKVLHVSQHENPALFWAMKGGGGSVWGIVTSITIRAHKAQPAGYPQFNISTTGTFCKDDSHGSHNYYWLKRMLQNYADWQLSLNNKFSIQVAMFPQRNNASTAGDYCKATWTFVLQYIYNGPASDPDHIAGKDAVTAILEPRLGDANNLTIFPRYYGEITQYPANRFDMRGLSILPQPAPTTSASMTGAQSSAILSRQMMQSQWAVTFMEILEWCPEHGQCGWHYLYGDLTGNIGSPQPGDTPLNPGMRSGLLLHLARNLSETQLHSTLYNISDYTYFSESAFAMRQWGNRYWGSNFDLLRAVKKLHDPFDIFWCHHCIGDDPNSSD